MTTQQIRDQKLVHEWTAVLGDYTSDDFKEHNTEVGVPINDLASLLDIIDRQSQRIAELEAQ